MSSSVRAVGSPCLEDPVHRMGSHLLGPESQGVSCCSEGDWRLREAQGGVSCLGASVPRRARWKHVGVGRVGRVLLREGAGFEPSWVCCSGAVTSENHINFLKLWQNTHNVEFII